MGMLDGPVVLLGLYCVPCIVIVNHYILVGPVYRSIRQNRWWLIFPFILAVYLLSLSSIFFVKFLADLYPEFPIIKRHYELRKVNEFSDLFNLESFRWFFNVIFIYNIISILCFIAKRFFESQQNQLLLLKEKNKIELDFLRSQIQPHFLFNTLNNIYGQVIDNEQASQSIVKLSDLLRFSLYGSSKGVVKLEEEIKFLTDYIALEKIRHKASKVDIQYCFDEINHPDLEISPLILVNFVENSFKHGVNASIGNSWANIVLKEKEKVVTFSVSNSIGKSEQQKKPMGGLGLENVRRRLDLEYRGRYDLSLKETLDRYDVVLTLKPKT